MAIPMPNHVRHLHLHLCSIYRVSRYICTSVTPALPVLDLFARALLYSLSCIISPTLERFIWHPPGQYLFTFSHRLPSPHLLIDRASSRIIHNPFIHWPSPFLVIPLTPLAIILPCFRRLSQFVLSVVDIVWYILCCYVVSTYICDEF